MTRIRKDIPLISILLVGMNVVMFGISLCRKGELWRIGLLGVSEVMVDREYGRMIYSMFLHADLEHLFNNMLILLFLGAMLEKEVGHTLLLFVYMVSGLAGNAFSLGVQMLSGEFHYSLGASGAVFGLDGLLLAIVLFAGRRFPDITPQRILVMLILSLYSGAKNGGVDNAAHAGGLIGGFLSGVIVCFILYRKDRRAVREY